MGYGSPGLSEYSRPTPPDLGSFPLDRGGETDEEAVVKQEASVAYKRWRFHLSLRNVQRHHETVSRVSQKPEE